MKRCMIGIFFGALILTLSVYMYLCMAFPDDVVEDVVQEISCNDRKVVIGKRGGGATVGNSIRINGETYTVYNDTGGYYVNSDVKTRGLGKCT